LFEYEGHSQQSSYTDGGSDALINDDYDEVFLALGVPVAEICHLDNC
jgi:hypothetical protein